MDFFAPCWSVETAAIGSCRAAGRLDAELPIKLPELTDHDGAE